MSGARRLVLASASPRRLSLLRDAGFDPEVVVPGIDESPRPGEDPTTMVLRLATEKALSGSRECTGIGPCVVLAADTAVVLDGGALGKPDDRAHAAAMLHRLSGRRHEVLTGFAIADGDGRVLHREAVATTVTFHRLDPAVIEEYVATGEPLDKAGGCDIQGRGAGFVAFIDGDHSNVVGLPISDVAAVLAGLGVGPPRPR